MAKTIRRKNEGKRKRNKYGLLLHMIFLASATLLAIILCILSTVEYLQLKKNNRQLSQEVTQLTDELDHSYSEEQMQELVSEAKQEQAVTSLTEGKKLILDYIQNHLSTGSTVLDTLKALYPDDLVVADKGYHFIPISDELTHHPFNLNQFIADEDGYLQYHENGQILSKKGIDVSRYQEKIDWKKVAKTGIEYVFIRSGVRGYTKGEIKEDDRFVENIEGALEADLDVGVYFVTQAMDEEEAIEEAEFVLDQIADYEVTYPIVLDVEDIENGEARSASLTMDERTKCIIAFCDTIREAGYEPMIYGNMKSFMRRMNLEELEDYKKWIAYYDTNLYFPYAFDVWQYTDQGKADGIKGNVDYNISFYEP